MPIFDPYKTQRQQSYLGVEIPGGSPSPQATASGAIAYFHEDTQLHDKVLNGLLGANIDIVAYFGQPLRRLVKKLRESRVSIVDAPFKLRTDVPGRAVAVHMGGLGFSAAAVLAGVPQVIVYLHEEHWFTANAIVRAGAGAAAQYKDVTAKALTEAIDRVAASSAMRERVLQLAEENAAFKNATPTQAIADIAMDFF